ncbi:MAG: replication initiator protein [Microviridae sp.]|nr:MAG: replication initiator protein [Microviridae sp.]
MGCRVDYSRNWALRCSHELQFHSEACVVTLTYDDEHLPPGQTLVKKDFQEFIHALRNRCRSKNRHGKWIQSRVTYFASGEYGENLGRPHYHAILYGVDFPDKIRVDTAADGSPLYSSEACKQIWGKGNITVGVVTYASAAYIARYIMKKITGEHAPYWYEHRIPEFALMSTRPAIGKRWVDEFLSDIYPSDFIIYKGKKHKVPRYYDKQLKKREVEKHKAIKQTRFKTGLKKEIILNNRPARLAVREEVHRSRVTHLKRNL